ncbi:hypothetical protein NDU88_009099 [Pleurodeles waltl]|uniref:Uncharacterized protein n=1 Tax=Pleurodeles waltl TaxID=8319 RepID=A0AAV7QQN5_PLEWA|nr:hypothetical protein NDU88_009099 [Pleurodeles waltl]
MPHGPRGLGGVVRALAAATEGLHASLCPSDPAGVCADPGGRVAIATAVCLQPLPEGYQQGSRSAAAEGSHEGEVRWSAGLWLGAVERHPKGGRTQRTAASYQLIDQMENLKDKVDDHDSRLDHLESRASDLDDGQHTSDERLL